MNPTSTTTLSPTTQPKFSPHTYLQGLGWTPGQPLTLAPHARAKPITVAHKKTLSGLGKDRDTSYNWWEAVFESLAGKVKEAQDRTSTGLISPLPPRPKPSALDSHYQPTPSTSTSTSAENPTEGGGRLNWEAMGRAKMEMARRQLYASFLRGKVIGSTAEEEVVVEVKGLQGAKPENKDRKGKDKDKKKKGKELDVDGDGDEGRKARKKSRKRKAEEDIQVEGKEVTGKASKKSKKKDRREKKDKDASSTTVDERSAEVDEAQKIARMVAEEERRSEKKLAKAARKAGTGGGM